MERGNFWGAVKKLVEEHKLIRRLTLGWAVWLISIVVLRVTDPAVLEHVNGATATIVTGVLGLLTTVIAFYQWSRHQERGNASDSSKHP